MSTLTLTDKQLTAMSHSLINTLNEYERLPFGTFPEERALREALVTKLDILAWHISPEPDSDIDDVAERVGNLPTLEEVE